MFKPMVHILTMELQTVEKELRYTKRKVIIATRWRKIRWNNERNSWRWFLVDMNIIFWLFKNCRNL